MMVFEKLPFSFDIKKLRHYLHNVVLPIGDPICPIEPGFGGWSVTSDTGSWKSGWKEKRQVVTLPENYNKPTELCIDYMAEILDFLTIQGLEPTKARISVLPPKGVSSIHRDYPGSEWRARLHIPILTNEQCCHIIYNKDLTEKVEYHMSADGSAYMFWVNLRHQYKNLSNENRYHLVIDVKDTKGITENFKCITQ
jgi:aspartyl/asparaginyl beta-hydroxylase (cupin superfamily)